MYFVYLYFVCLLRPFPTVSSCALCCDTAAFSPENLGTTVPSCFDQDLLNLEVSAQPSSSETRGFPLPYTRLSLCRRACPRLVNAVPPSFPLLLLALLVVCTCLCACSSSLVFFACLQWKSNPSDAPAMFVCARATVSDSPLKASLRHRWALVSLPHQVNGRE